MAETRGRVELLRELANQTVFSTAQFRALTGETEASARVHLMRLRRSGEVHSLWRDRFTVHDDPWLVASHIVWPSYISLWSAFRHHGMTTQVPGAVWVVTSARAHDTDLGGREIRFVTTKPKAMFGYRKEWYRGFEVFIAEPEKAIIDALLLRRLPFWAVREALQVPRAIRRDRLVGMARRTGNGAVAKRVGYLLEESGYGALDRLRDLVHRDWTLLDWAMPASGRRDARWRLVVNAR